MKLYGNPMSTCTRKVLTTLAEKGATAELVTIDLGKREQKSPEHLARQPFGVVPVLEDEGFRLYESRAIIRYLDDKLGGARLTPSDAKERARMEQWISVEQSYFSPAAMQIVYQLMLIPMRGGQTDPAKVEEGRQKTAHALDVLEPALAEKPYFGGDQFSLGDITYMPYVEYLFSAKQGDLITSRPHVAAWWNRVSERPSWQRVARGK